MSSVFRQDRFGRGLGAAPGALPVSPPDLRPGLVSTTTLPVNKRTTAAAPVIPAAAPTFTSRSTSAAPYSPPRAPVPARAPRPASASTPLHFERPSGAFYTPGPGVPSGLRIDYDDTDEEGSTAAPSAPAAIPTARSGPTPTGLRLAPRLPAASSAETAPAEVVGARATPPGAVDATPPPASAASSAGGDVDAGTAAIPPNVIPFRRVPTSVSASVARARDRAERGGGSGKTVAVGLAVAGVLLLGGSFLLGRRRKQRQAGLSGPFYPGPNGSWTSPQGAVFWQDQDPRVAQRSAQAEPASRDRHTSQSRVQARANPPRAARSSSRA